MLMWNFEILRNNQKTNPSLDARRDFFIEYTDYHLLLPFFACWKTATKKKQMKRRKKKDRRRKKRRGGKEKSKKKQKEKKRKERRSYALPTSAVHSSKSPPPLHPHPPSQPTQHSTRANTKYWKKKGTKNRTTFAFRTNRFPPNTTASSSHTDSTPIPDRTPCVYQPPSPRPTASGGFLFFFCLRLFDFEDRLSAKVKHGTPFSVPLPPHPNRPQPSLPRQLLLAS